MARTQDEIIDTILGDGGRETLIAWLDAAVEELMDRGPRAHDPDPVGYHKMLCSIDVLLEELREMHLVRRARPFAYSPRKRLGRVDISRRKAVVAARKEVAAARKVAQDPFAGIPF